MAAGSAARPREAPAGVVEKRAFLAAPVSPSSPRQGSVEEADCGRADGSRAPGAAADSRCAEMKPSLAIAQLADEGKSLSSLRTITAPTYRTRWLYFAQFAWASCFARFMSLYYLEDGLNEAQIGAVFSAGSLTGPFVSTMVGLTADRLSARHRGAKHVCYAICVILGTVSFTAQLLRTDAVPRLHVLMACRIAFNACNTSANVLLDAITLECLTDKRRYGEERLYGAVSWAIMHTALGILIDRFGKVVQHVLILVMCMCSMVAMMVIGIPKRADCELDQSGTPSKRKPAGLVALADNRALCALFADWCSKKTVLAFFLYTVVLGYGMTIVEHLIFLYFKELNASNFLCGLSVVVTVVFEIPLFKHSKFLLERFGEQKLLTMAGLCYSFRVVGYTLCPGGWSVLFFEPMHGVTVAMVGTASVQLMAAITPPAFVATGQAFLSLLRSCLGSFLGTLVGGTIIREYGESACYRSSALLVFGGLLVYRSSGVWCSDGGPIDDKVDAASSRRGVGIESPSQAAGDAEGFPAKPETIGRTEPAVA